MKPPREGHVRNRTEKGQGMTKWNANLQLVLGGVVNIDSVGEIASEEPGPEQMAEMRETIARVMAKLTRIEKDVIVAIAEGETHAEIAERLDITVRAVRGIIGTVRRKAKEEL